ncbi:MAG: ATP-binding protein [Succinivibrio sp.]|nr:ATP-binding protein [Succinivibrio sp.]
MITVKLPAKIEELENINETLRTYMTGELEPLLMKTQLVVEELLANICNYAYDGKSGNAEFSVGVVTFDGEPYIRISFVDGGKPFNPFKEERDPHVNDSVESRPVGGLGIHFVKNMSNHYIYSRLKECNVVDIFIEAKGYSGNK